MKVLIKRGKWRIPLYFPRSFLPLKRIIKKLYEEKNLSGDPDAMAKVIKANLKRVKKYHKRLYLLDVEAKDGTVVKIRL